MSYFDDGRYFAVDRALLWLVSDRSGLASALYVAAVERGGEEAAERQISIRYGHISLPLSSTFAMDRTFEFLEPWLGYHDS